MRDKIEALIITAILIVMTELMLSFFFPRTVDNAINQFVGTITWSMLVLTMLIIVAGIVALLLSTVGGSVWILRNIEGLRGDKLNNILRSMDLEVKSAEVKILEAKAFATQAEGLAKLHQVTAIKPGHEAVITQIQHPMLPTEYNVSRNYVPALPDKNIHLLPSPQVEIETMATIRSGPDWIREFLFDDYGQLKVFHVKTDGPTGVGKTYLMLHLMWLLQQPHPAAEYWLLDPKFEGKESGWPFEPFVTDFDQVAEGAEYLYHHVVTARKHAKRDGQAPKYPAFLLFDETDGCFDEHGDKFTKPVRRIIKEGRSGWTHCFMAGQSPLAKDAGFSGALFRNTARFIMGNEALAFTRNAQFTFWEKDHREKLSRQLMHLQEHSKRYALVVPPSGQGLPFVGEIPPLDNKPNFVNLAPPLAQLETIFNHKSSSARMVESAITLTKPTALPNGYSHYANGFAATHGSGNQAVDSQFLQDLQTVVAQMQQVRYRGGKPVRASIAEILGLPDGGREYNRIQAIAQHLEKHMPQSN